MNNLITAIDRDGQQFTELIFNVDNWKQYLFSVEETMLTLSGNIKYLEFVYDISVIGSGRVTIDYGKLDYRIFNGLSKMIYEEFIVLMNIDKSPENFIKSKYYNKIKVLDVYPFPERYFRYESSKNNIVANIKTVKFESAYLPISYNGTPKVITNTELYKDLPKEPSKEISDIQPNKNILYYVKCILYPKYNLFTLIKKVF